MNIEPILRCGRCVVKRWGMFSCVRLARAFRSLEISRSRTFRLPLHGVEARQSLSLATSLDQLVTPRHRRRSDGVVRGLRLRVGADADGGGEEHPATAATTSKQIRFRSTRSDNQT